MSRTHTLTVAFIALLFGLAIFPTAAIEIPPPTSVAFIQTSGRLAGLNIGDFYTSSLGDDDIHVVEVYVPCGWPVGLTITFAIFDPESSGPNPATAPFAFDEVRGANDQTQFELFNPAGTSITGLRTFTAASGTNGLWVEMLTFRPSDTGFGCGAYRLETSTGNGSMVVGDNNDDNAWRLIAGHDPDCPVSPSAACSGIGAAQSALLGNGNSSGDPDGAPGTGDEVTTSFLQLSFQHQSFDCQTFFFFVDNLDPDVTLHNFDFDDTNPAINITVTYFPPPGSILGASLAGTTSLRSSWNGAADNPGNSPNPPRVGDTYPVTDTEVGWWQSEVCINDDNQYIFEGEQDTPVFYEQPPFPILTLAKDNGVTQVSASGQQVTYTINYANTNPVGAPTFGGAAVNAVIRDTMPTGSTFVACTGGCTVAGSIVSWNVGTIPAPPNAGSGGSVTVTVALPAGPVGGTHTNNVCVDFTDIIGAPYPPECASDTDTIIAGPPVTPTPPPTGPTSGTGGPTSPASNPAGAVIRKVANPVIALPGQEVSWSVEVVNPSGGSITGVQVTDTLPPELEYLSASATQGTVRFIGGVVTADIGTLAAGQTVTLTIRTRILSTVAVPYTTRNIAVLNYAGIGTPISAQAQAFAPSTLPATGESPWSRWRAGLVAILIAGGAGLGVWSLRRAANLF